MDDISYTVTVNILDIKAALTALKDRQEAVVEELLEAMLIPHYEELEDLLEEE